MSNNRLCLDISKDSHAQLGSYLRETLHLFREGNSIRETIIESKKVINVLWINSDAERTRIQKALKEHNPFNIIMIERSEREINELLPVWENNDGPRF